MIDRIQDYRSLDDADKRESNEMEKVTIIIPVFNGEKYIEDTIESARNQNYDNLEIILIDDESKDSSFRIISNIVDQDDRVVCYQNQKNQGLIKSLNYGISKSTGKYIICLGQDDLLEPNHVKVMVSKMKPNVSFAYCQCDLINEKGEVFKVREHVKNTEIDVFELSKANQINSCGLMMRKKHIDMVGGYTELKDLPNYGEWEMWIKLASVGDVLYVNEIKSKYRRHESNISKSFYNFNTRKKLWKYYVHSRRAARKLGDFTFKQHAAYSVYTFIFIAKFIYRTVVGEANAKAMRGQS